MSLSTRFIDRCFDVEYILLEKNCFYLIDRKSSWHQADAYKTDLST